MKRKVNQLGNQSFSITLPINWIKKNRLNKQKSEVNIHEFDKELKIEVEKRQLFESTNIFTNQYASQEELINAIVEKYREGYKAIKITFNDKEEIIRDIYNRFEHFWGIDAIRVNNQITLTSTSSNNKVDEIIKKSFFIIIHLAEIDNIKEAIDLNTRLQLINEYALRLLNTEVSLPTEKLIRTARITQSLVNLGNCIKRVKHNSPHLDLSPYLKRLYNMKYKINGESTIFKDLQKIIRSKTTKVKEDIYFLINLCKELL